MNSFEIWAYRSLIVLLLSILSTLIGFLIFWLRRFVKGVDNLTDIVGKLQTQEAVNEKNCEKTHQGVDARLKDHRKDIDEMGLTIKDHEKRIGKLEK